LVEQEKKKELTALLRQREELALKEKELARDIE